ncbi:MAG TPA: ABC transporter substrate-binding protein [Candidatus Limnocylindrales bacterium]|nr:ABC transporter substrate-binding protein [Candidatus Limnocylindrales bacterium]
MKIRLCTAMLAIAVSTVPAQGADKVRIGVSNYNISNLTVGVAQTKDFFKQEGIEAEIIRMNPNVATMALVSGDIDYSTLIGSVIGANLKGAKLKMIACSQDRTPLSLVGKAAIKSVKELKGKTIGVGSYGSTPDIIARMVVKHYGVDPETEIKMIALGSDSARLTALKEGVVDAIIVAPPVDFEGKKMGFNILSRAGDILRFPYNGLGTSVEKITERPDGVKRVIRAIVRANGFIRRNREGAIQVLVNWTKTKPEFAEAAYDSTVGVFSQDGTIPEDGLRLVIENFRQSMNLSRQVSLSDVSDSTLLFQVQRELGIKK